LKYLLVSCASYSVLLFLPSNQRVIFHVKYYSYDEIRKKVLDGAWGTYGGDGRCLQSFGGDLMERDHLEYLDIDGMLILKWVFKNWNGKV
jgi:hypothetical protein